MTAEGIYYKTIKKNILTGETDFYITPDENYGDCVKNGLLMCRGNIGVFVKGMPIRMTGDVVSGIFILQDYEIPTGTKECTDRLLSWIDDSLTKTQKNIISDAVDDDLLGFVKKGCPKERILKKLVPEDFMERYENKTVTSDMMKNYHKSSVLVKQIYRKVKTLLEQEEMVSELLKTGVDIGKIELLCKKGIDMDTIRKNPYLLLLKFDIPISVAEAIYFNQKSAKKYSLRRLCGYLYDAMSATRDGGNTCYEIKELLKVINYRMKTVTPSGIGESEMSLSMLNMCIKGMEDTFSYRTTDNGQVFVYFNEIIKQEDSIIDNIRRLQNGRHEMEEKLSISEIEKDLGITYNKEQREAFGCLKTSGIKILTGPPGSGKTAVIRGFIKYFGENGTVRLAATTGMAAKVMTDACQMHAETVNQMLGLSYFGEESFASHDINNPIDADMIVVDEVSMLGVKLLHSLLKAVKSGSILLLVGDENQLQSVEYGNILHDLIKSGVIETYRLKEILRQSGTICENAFKINMGRSDLVCNDNFCIYRFNNNEDAVKSLLETKKNDKSIVLTPTKLSKNYGTRFLNPLMQKGGEILFSYGDMDFRMGDRVVMTRNNYDTGYFNGDKGVITGFKNGIVTVMFADRILDIGQTDICDMELGYALTIHKAQGSEYDEVYILLQDKARNLATRRLLYTAVTRARKKVIIYEVNDSVKNCILNMCESMRCSNLCLSLQKLKTITDGYNEDKIS